MWDPERVAYGDYSHTSGFTVMQQLLKQSPDLDAVFVNSDLMAIGAINVHPERWQTGSGGYCSHRI